MEHSASRDGTVNWQTSPEHISQTLDAIEFLASRLILTNSSRIYQPCFALSISHISCPPLRLLPPHLIYLHISRSMLAHLSKYPHLICIHNIGMPCILPCWELSFLTSHLLHMSHWIFWCLFINKDIKLFENILQQLT